MTASRFNSITREVTPDKVVGIKVLSPASGAVSVIANQYPGQLTEGVAIKLTGHFVVAPFSATIIDVTPSHGKVTMKAKNGIIVMLQLPSSYAHYMGEGINPKVNVGDTVQAGQTIMELDLYKIQSHLSAPFLEFVVVDNRPFARIQVPLKTVVAGKDVIFSLVPRPKPNK